MYYCHIDGDVFGSQIRSLAIYPGSLKEVSQYFLLSGNEVYGVNFNNLGTEYFTFEIEKTGVVQTVYPGETGNILLSIPNEIISRIKIYCGTGFCNGSVFIS